MIRPCLSVLAAVLVLHAADVSAQSLVEVARRERERRANLGKPPPSGELEEVKQQPRVRRPSAETPSTELPTVEVGEAPEVISPLRQQPRPLPDAPVVLSPTMPDLEETLATGNSLLARAEHAAAAEAFRSILRADPSHRGARLGLGRAYARSGNHSAGREEFRRVLAANPGDPEAMIGIAQTYQWSGVGPMAREWYEKALAIDPALEEAEVGLGYIEIWNEPAVAAARAGDLEHRFPASANVRALRDEAGRARAPQVHVSLDRQTDTNLNELDTAWVEGRLGLSSSWDLWLGGAHYAMSFLGAQPFGSPGEGSVTSLYGVLRRPVARGQRIDLRLGVDYRKDTTDATGYVPIGGVGWSWGLDRKWSGRVSYDRDSFRYTTQALDDAIVFDAFSASVTNRIAPNWLIDGEVGYWDVGGKPGADNERLDAMARVRYRKLFRGEIPLEAAYSFQYFTYERDFGAAFFSPSFYRGHRFDVGVSGPLGSLFEYRILGGAGVQSYDLVSLEPLWTAGGTLSARLGSGYRLELFGHRGDYLILSNFPVRTEQFGVRIRWQGGELR